MALKRECVTRLNKISTFHNSLYDTLEEKEKQRELYWREFFKTWNKSSVKSVAEDIPFKYLTGRNKYFDKRKLLSYKKVRRKKLPNPKGEKLLQQFQEHEPKDGDSVTVADDDVSSKCQKDSILVISEKLNTTKSGNEYEDDEVSPVLKKPRLRRHFARKSRTDIDGQNSATPMKSNKDHRKGGEEKVPGEDVCNRLDGANSSFKIELAANKPHSRTCEPEEVRDHRRGCDRKVPREDVCNALDGGYSSVKSELAANKPHSCSCQPEKSQDHRKGGEEKVPGEHVCNRLDGANSSFKIELAANKPHSRSCNPEKSRDHGNGCEHEVLPSVSEECMHNGLGGFHSSSKTSNSHSQQSKSSKSRGGHRHFKLDENDYTYPQKSSSELSHKRSVSRVKRKPWPYIIVENDTSDDEY